MDESHMPAPAWTPDGCSTFHSRRIAPAPYKIFYFPRTFEKKKEREKKLTGPDSHKHKVSDFHDTLRARRSNPEYRLWAILVLEGGALASKHSPSLSDHLSSGRNSNGRSNNIDTSIKEDDFTTGILESRYPK